VKDSNLSCRKSHLAYHFAARFMETDKFEERKHTFWVEASHRSNFQKSLRRIATDINIDTSDTVDIVASVKAWLADGHNGPWIMVIDGLDSIALAKDVKMALPEDCGQLLITTKVRDVLKYFVELNRDDRCLHVGDLGLQDCRKIFLSHAWDASVDENSPELNDLLKLLALPIFVKMVAKYVTQTRQPLKAMYKNLQPGKSEHVRTVIYRFFDQIFSPLLPASSKQPTGAFRVLGELSCLCKEGFEFDLIAKGYPDEGHLWEMLGKLQNCSFIGQDEGSGFFMHSFVQRAVREVIEKRMGLASILQLHGNALCMLFLLYTDQRQEREDTDAAEAKKIRRSSYLWKLRFMPHFERFLEFAKDHGNKHHEFSKFAFEDRMVKSVTTFAQVFLDEGRYDDAVCVLDFTKKLYKGAENRYQLGHLLLQAHLLRPGSHESKRNITEIEDLLNELIKVSEEDKKMEQTWRLHLEFAELDCRLKRPEKAFERLKKCTRKMELFVKDGRPRLYSCPDIGLDSKTKKELVILLRIEEAKAHLSCAKMSNSEGQISAASMELQRAQDCFNDAKLGIAKWFPEADEWLMEVDENIAGVFSEIGTPEALEKAETLLKKRLNWLKSHCDAANRSWSQKGWCDLRCKIARIHLKRAMEGGKEHLQKEAISILEETLQYYEKWYGKKDGHTQKCASWLRDALKADGQADAVHDLERRVGLKAAKKHDRSVQQNPSHSKCKIMVGFLGVFVITFALVFWVYGYSAWRGSMTPTVLLLRQ